MTNQINTCTICEGRGRLYGVCESTELMDCPGAEICTACWGSGGTDEENCAECAGLGAFYPRCPDCAETDDEYAHFGQLIDGSYVWRDELYIGKPMEVSINTGVISWLNPMDADFDPETNWVRPANVYYTHSGSHFWFKYTFSVCGEELFNERSMPVGLPLFGSGFRFSDAIPEELLRSALTGVLAAVAMQPGDTDEAWFDGYTPAQMAWAESYPCECLSGYANDLEELEG